MIRNKELFAQSIKDIVSGNNNIPDNQKLSEAAQAITLTGLRHIFTTFRNDGRISKFSDGYHTFDELYYHRMILTSVLVSNYRSIAFKSKLHNDGTMYDGMFIVGFEIPYPDGSIRQASYHFDLKYWDNFDCKELERAPKFDGHTPNEAIERIAFLTKLNIQ